MKPIDPLDAPGKRVLFAADQPEYLPLPARRLDNAVYTRWQLTLWERLLVLFGRCIDIEVLVSGALQPILPYVEGMKPEAKKSDEPV